jgi:regulator of extracellular matrix RemA (YlzA/DUF370 family)
MQAEFVHVGFSGSIAVHRVLAVASPDSAPLKRMIRQAAKEGRIIDLTYGRKAKCVIVLDSGHVVLAAFQPRFIMRRIAAYRAGGVDALALEPDDGAQPPGEEDAGEH